ncbi:hypothetical protein [Clostridium botulinum]|uniref:hypothetical protein n=1 Tax=Clostridium botulinum TaxID=1491 RepID=UPI000772E370|nr:hypothetical protein [Clostridium botulinum]MBY6932116.1 hypothetical protein [Clostridium botulinum]NFG20331.1 hypothetical protein [Clostridium botulinum]NFO38904.1 hypothetical protein [Clostridium botulinum]NFO82478.1 hypothetical protein [Clostridium botulinum]
MVSLKMLKQKSATVSSLVEDVRHQLPDNDVAEDLENNYDELYSMILSVCETLDAVVSDIEK